MRGRSTHPHAGEDEAEKGQVRRPPCSAGILEERDRLWPDCPQDAAGNVCGIRVGGKRTRQPGAEENQKGQRILLLASAPRRFWNARRADPQQCPGQCISRTASISSIKGKRRAVLCQPIWKKGEKASTTGHATGYGYSPLHINERIMLGGATLIDPANTYIDADVTVGQDSVICSGVILEETKIGAGCTLYQGARGSRTAWRTAQPYRTAWCWKAEVGAGAQVKFYAYIPPGHIHQGALPHRRFVETSTIAQPLQVSHLT